MMASPDLALEKGLPANPDAERYVLGSILLNDSLYLQVAGVLESDDFSLEKHRRIFGRMKDRGYLGRDDVPVGMDRDEQRSAFEGEAYAAS